VITHGDQSINISCAAQGALSSSPLTFIQSKIFNIPVQSILLMKNMFWGIDAKDLLIKMIKSPNCIDGCKLVSSQPKNNKTQFRKGAWTFVCSHGIVMNDMVESHFDPDSVGKSHVPIQGLKCTKSRGCSVKGTWILFLI
jgi:hypothetical protein